MNLIESRGRKPACVVTSEIFEVLKKQESFDSEKFARTLSELPQLPQDKRIYEILGKDCEHNRQNALRYFNYLKSKIKYPCKLTGMEDFPWEEKYVIGGWDQKEYEKRKKDNPSYSDEYELIELIEPESWGDEIFAKVRRLSDQKIFTIGLSWLECTDNESVNYQLMDDYAMWHTNY